MLKWVGSYMVGAKCQIEVEPARTLTLHRLTPLPVHDDHDTNDVKARI
jgi:hypothetical protein